MENINSKLNNPTVFTVKNKNKTITFELPWDATMDDYCHAFYTICVGMTFHPDTVARCMQEFANEMYIDNRPLDNKEEVVKSSLY